MLIKPNLLTDRSPECAVTTHPEVVRAIIRLVRRLGAKPVVADSCASAIEMEFVWDRTGFLALCDEESVPLLNLEQSGARGFDVDGMRFSIAKPVLDADIVINVPKLKTHVLTVLTNAVKNMYGAMPGYQKTMGHKRYTHPSRIGEFISVLYSIIRPGLTVCDAIVGMDGSGPSGGDPAPLGFIAASKDGVALDAAMCELLNIDIKLVPYFEGLKRRGVGDCDIRNIEMVGDLADSFALSRFRLPSTALKKMIPERLVAMVRPFVWIRPSFTDRCTRCGLCVKACPVSALSMGRNFHPDLQGGLCIECCCCHEICPSKAIEMEHSPLVRLLFSRRFPK